MTYLLLEGATWCACHEHWHQEPETQQSIRYLQEGLGWFRATPNWCDCDQHVALSLCRSARHSGLTACACHMGKDML